MFDPSIRGVPLTGDTYDRMHEEIYKGCFTTATGFPDNDTMDRVSRMLRGALSMDEAHAEILEKYTVDPSAAPSDEQ